MKSNSLICISLFILCLSLLYGCSPQEPTRISDPSRNTSEHTEPESSYTGPESIPPTVTVPNTTFPEVPEVIRVPEDAVKTMFSAGSGFLGLIYDEDTFPYYDLNDMGYASPAERFLHIIGLYVWEYLPDYSESMSQPDRSVFIIAAKDHSQEMKFFSQGETNYILYKTSDELYCWHADVSSYSGKPARMITAFLRRDYDNMEFDFSRIRFECKGDAAAVTEFFLKTALPEFLDSLEPESLFRIKDYSPYGYNLSDTSSVGNTVNGVARIYVVPQDPEDTGWYGLNTIEGMGQYDGWLMMELPFSLRLQEDGMWQYVSDAAG